MLPGKVSSVYALGPRVPLGESSLGALLYDFKKVLPSLKLLQGSTTRGQQSSLEGARGTWLSLGRGAWGHLPGSWVELLRNREKACSCPAASW